MENVTVVKKGGYWALVMGVLYIPAAFIVGMFGLMSGFLLDSPGSETLWYVKAIFFLCVVIHPLMCIVASISGFVYHFKNKYGTGAKINRRLITVPAVYFLILIIAISALMFFVF